MEEIRELLEEKKITELREKFNDMNSVDLSVILSEIYDELGKENFLRIFRILNKGKAGEVFSHFEPEMQENLIHGLTDVELKNVMNELFMDDVVDLIEEMPSNVVKRILANTTPQNRKVINELLKYPEETAGSLMTTEFIDFKENMTVSKAFEFIKEKGLKKETVYNCYVLTVDRKLIGVIDIKELLIAERDTLVTDIMDTNVIKANTLDNQEEVIKMFDKYDCLALPVVDKEDRLVGIITIDDAIDVLQKETLEDFEKMAAIAPSEDSYLKTGVFTHAKNRILWLLILTLSATITGAIITKYENAFAALPLLVSFIPMIMDTGGNCGAQSSTLIIRGLATDEIKLKDIFRVIWKELRVAILVGLALALIEGVILIFRYQDIRLSITLGLTLMLTVILSKLLGCCLPILAKKIKLDPALMASPLITTIVDTCSVFIFFVVATRIMF